jgi:uncharacterized membrane protein YhaH (DUF805 family)
MNWTWFLFRFNGRIGRAQLWLALLVILGGMGSLSELVVRAGKPLGGPRAISIDLTDIFAILDPETFGGLTRADLVPAALRVVLIPVFVWMFAATAVKRLHDRDMSGWWLVPFFVVPGLINQFGDRLGGETLTMVAGTVAAVIWFWGFIDLYCLAGDRSSNRFGASQLPEVEKRSRSARARTAREHAAWDQHGELEFAPHIAGPPVGEAAFGSTSRPAN